MKEFDDFVLNQEAVRQIFHHSLDRVTCLREVRTANQGSIKVGRYQEKDTLDVVTKPPACQNQLKTTSDSPKPASRMMLKLAFLLGVLVCGSQGGWCVCVCVRTSSFADFVDKLRVICGSQREPRGREGWIVQLDRIL
ncbi:hypothetical protein D4764_03G0010050 [Takifugu flavidus]|uniref:Uncharacterized protein n=1 Tax=Takifugu flavidus TaxID=433684 RepID=A0A5C6NEU6_9TELE|nr:hypothetical protein D4764_03G0010050 [Takifugu flavidus]